MTPWCIGQLKSTTLQLSLTMPTKNATHFIIPCREHKPQGGLHPDKRGSNAHMWLFTSLNNISHAELQKTHTCSGRLCNWRGAWNKVLSESFCNVKFSLIFSSKYKVIWKESMAIDQKSLKAFFHAPFQLSILIRDKIIIIIIIILMWKCTHFSLLGLIA